MNWWRLLAGWCRTRSGIERIHIIDQKEISLKDFDLSGFIKGVLAFNRTVLSTEFDPSYAIVEVSEIGGIPQYGPESGGRDIETELIKEGKRLFFPFTATNVGEPIRCADGEGYELDEDESELCLGMTDCVGYLVQVKNESLIINSAVSCGGACPAPPPSVDLLEDCDVFGEPFDVN